MYPVITAKNAGREVSSHKPANKVFGMNKNLYSFFMHGKVIDTVEEKDLNKNNYPIKGVAIVRTDKENKVLMHEGKFCFIYDCPNSIEGVLANDICMCTAQKLFMETLSEDHIREYIPRTWFMPVGAFFNNGVFYLVSNVVITSDILKEGYKFEDIKKLKSKNPVEYELLKTLTFTKDEEVHL
jgi:hypothetical protein